MKTLFKDVIDFNLYYCDKILMHAHEQIHFIYYDQSRLNKVNSDFEQKCSKTKTLLPKNYIDLFYKCKIQKFSFSPYLLFSSHRHL
jgi:hypothetical protein